MRILDNKNDVPLENILVMLTPSEAKMMKGFLNGLTSEKGDHIHIDDISLEHEITIAIYTPENKDTFAPRIIDLIENDK